MQVYTAIPLFPSPSSFNGTSRSRLDRIRSKSTQSLLKILILLIILITFITIIITDAIHNNSYHALPVVQDKSSLDLLLDAPRPTSLLRGGKSTIDDLPAAILVVHQTLIVDDESPSIRSFSLLQEIRDPREEQHDHQRFLVGEDEDENFIHFYWNSFESAFQDKTFFFSFRGPLSGFDSPRINDEFDEDRDHPHTDNDLDAGGEPLIICGGNGSGNTKEEDVLPQPPVTDDHYYKSLEDHTDDWLSW